MTSKHTPGPWGYSLPDLDIFRDDRDREDVQPLIATVYRENVTSEQADADARLIAEAPAMLEALRKADFALETAEAVFAERGQELKEVTRGRARLSAILARIDGEAGQ